MFPTSIRNFFFFVAVVFPIAVLGDSGDASVDFSLAGCVTTCLASSGYSAGGKDNQERMCKASRAGLLETLLKCMSTTCSNGLATADSGLLIPMQKGCKKIEEPVPDDEIGHAQAAASSLASAAAETSTTSTQSPAPASAAAKPTTTPAAIQPETTYTNPAAQPNTTTAAADTPAAVAQAELTTTPAAIPTTTAMPLAKPETTTSSAAPGTSTTTQATTSTTDVVNPRPTVVDQVQPEAPTTQKTMSNSTTVEPTTSTKEALMPILASMYAQESGPTSTAQATSSGWHYEGEQTSTPSTSQETGTQTAKAASTTKPTEAETSKGTKLAESDALPTSASGSDSDSDELVTATTSDSVTDTGGALELATGTPEATTGPTTFMTSVSSWPGELSTVTKDNERTDPTNSSPFTYVSSPASRDHATCMLAAIPLVVAIVSSLF